jgi:menaquinone-9 beta-reductase
MRDAMFAGRTLAEEILPSLDDASAVDRATRAWEAARDRECLPAYHFANADTRVERQSPVLCELVRDAGRTPEPDLSDLFGRARTLREIAPPPRLARAVLAALWRGERPRAETLSRAVSEGRTALETELERRADRFRSTRTVTGSDHPGALWPTAPTGSRTSAGAPETSPAPLPGTQPHLERVLAAEESSP